MRRNHTHKSATFDLFGPRDLPSRMPEAHSSEVTTELPPRGMLQTSLPPSIYKTLLAALCVVFGALIVRLGVLQVMQGERWHAYAEGNRLRVELIPSRRGLITDRYGTPLTENTPAFGVETDVNAGRIDRDARVAQLEALKALGVIIDEDAGAAYVSDEVPFASFLLADGIAPEAAVTLMSQQDLFSGMRVIARERRTLAHDSIFAHIIGYVGKLNRNDWEKLKNDPQRYQWNDIVGKSGLEQYYERALRGVPGRRQIEVDARGQGETVVAEEPSRDGETLRLSLDMEMQNIAAGSLARAIRSSQGSGGAVIVMHPQTGEVLALLSEPNFDANKFSKGSAAYVNEVLNDSSEPLFNRAISGQYPIGSTIKPMIAAAALEERIVTPSERILSTGGLRVGAWFFPDWKTGGHGWVTLRDAIAESVNTYFYIIGGGYESQEGLGIARMVTYARRFGLGSVTGIDLTGEQPGFIPTPTWKEEAKRESWYVGDTYHFAIGQGDVLATPLQVAQMTSIFANGGYVVAPHLRIDAASVEENRVEGMRSEVISEVRNAMRATILTGSARSLSALPVAVAGKTGTAQTHGDQAPHAWFVGFAPFNNPEIALVVLIEHGGEGSVAAVPVAREIILWWYSNRFNTS